MSCIKHCVPVCVSMCIGMMPRCLSANIPLHLMRFSDVLLSLKAESDANSNFTG